MKKKTILRALLKAEPPRLAVSKINLYQILLIFKERIKGKNS